MKTNPELDALEQQLRLLRIEFEKYFNGAIDLPPGEMQTQVQTAVRDLRNRVKTSIDRFRLTSLEAKFNSYNEMFNRRLRAFEEGRVRPRGGPAVRPGLDPQSGVTVGQQVAEGAAAALYQGLYAGSAKAANVDLESFRGYLDKQAAMIRQKTGCSEVQFRLANEGGQVKLKAKPVRHSSGK